MSKAININIEKLIENFSVTGLKETEEAIKESTTETLTETINDDGVMYIRTDCLKIANGDIAKAQEYFEWIIKPLKIVP